MKMRQINNIILLVIVFVALCSRAAGAPDSCSTRQITPTQWGQLTSDRAFNYKNDIERIQPPENSQPGKFALLFEYIFGFLASPIGRVLVWIIVFFAIAYIIYKVITNNESFLFGRKKKDLAKAKTVDDGEDFYNTDWETLLNKSVQQSDFRAAVRYSYMWLLQILQSKQLISYKSDKTNFEYYSELQSTKYKQAFKQLSRKYEYTYYGNYPLSVADYSDYIEIFNNVKMELS